MVRAGSSGNLKFFRVNGLFGYLVIWLFGYLVNLLNGLLAAGCVIVAGRPGPLRRYFKERFSAAEAQRGTDGWVHPGHGLGGRL